jgi:hypothetical protein
MNINVKNEFDIVSIYHKDYDTEVVCRIRDEYYSIPLHHRLYGECKAKIKRGWCTGKHFIEAMIYEVDNTKSSYKNIPDDKKVFVTIMLETKSFIRRKCTFSCMPDGSQGVILDDRYLLNVVDHKIYRMDNGGALYEYEDADGYYSLDGFKSDYDSDEDNEPMTQEEAFASLGQHKEKKKVSSGKGNLTYDQMYDYLRYTKIDEDDDRFNCDLSESAYWIYDDRDYISETFGTLFVTDFKYFKRDADKKEDGELLVAYKHGRADAFLRNGYEGSDQCYGFYLMELGKLDENYMNFKSKKNKRLMMRFLKTY